MNDFIETFRSGLYRIGELTELLLNTLSLICIAGGVVLSLVRAVQDRQRRPGMRPMHTYFRRIFGGWLVVALEFQLAADIVGTIISPTNEHLIQLGAVAVIRTFLNYFLSRELKEESETLDARNEKKKELAI